MEKCLDKKRLIQRTACLTCPYRFKSCKMRQERVDSNIFLRVYLEERGHDEYQSLLSKNGKLYICFATTTQVSHVLRRINEKIIKIENSDDSDKLEKITKLKINRERFTEDIKDFHIIDFDDNSLNIFNELNKIDYLRMELHDKMNIAIAIGNKLNFQAVDTNLIEDFETIKIFSSPFGFKIELNYEY